MKRENQSVKQMNSELERKHQEFLKAQTKSDVTPPEGFVPRQTFFEEIRPVYLEFAGRPLTTNKLATMKRHFIKDPKTYRDCYMSLSVTTGRATDFYNKKKIIKLIKNNQLPDVETANRQYFSDLGKKRKAKVETRIVNRSDDNQPTGDDSVIVDIELQVVDRFFIIVPKEIRIGQDILDHLDEIGFDGIDFVSGMESPKMIMVSGDQFVVDVNTTTDAGGIVSSTVIECKTAEEAQIKRGIFVNQMNALLSAVSALKSNLNFADGVVRDVNYKERSTVALMRVPQLVPGCFVNDIVIIDPENPQRLICVSEDEIVASRKIGGIVDDSTIIFRA